MELYQDLLRSAETLAAAPSARRWAYDPARAWEDTGRSELVLQRDAAFELGGGGQPSVNLACIAMERKLPRDEVVLVGPDLPELRADAPFARIAVLELEPPAAADGLTGEDQLFRVIRSMEFVKYHVYPKGYMVRISSGSYREQVRVDKTALRRGLSFERVGCGYIRRYLENPFVRRAQVIFITDPGAPFGELTEQAKRADDIAHALDHMQEGMAMDCSSCNLKPVCDEVEGLRELHFGIQKESGETT